MQLNRILLFGEAIFELLSTDTEHLKRNGYEIEPQLIKQLYLKIFASPGLSHSGIKNDSIAFDLKTLTSTPQWIHLIRCNFSFSYPYSQNKETSIHSQNLHSPKYFENSIETHLTKN